MKTMMKPTHIKLWLPILNANRKPANGVAPILALFPANDTGQCLTDQIMSADKSRLKSKITVLTENDMASIEAAIKSFLGLL